MNETARRILAASWWNYTLLTCDIASRATQIEKPITLRKKTLSLKTLARLRKGLRINVNSPLRLDNPILKRVYALSDGCRKLRMCLEKQSWIFRYLSKFFFSLSRKPHKKSSKLSLEMKTFHSESNTRLPTSNHHLCLHVTHIFFSHDFRLSQISHFVAQTNVNCTHMLSPCTPAAAVAPSIAGM